MSNSLQPAAFQPAARRYSSDKQVGMWLLIGVGMIIIQVLLGGITRLTGSGLSITEWKPILGTIPPMNEREWNEAFNKYKEIAQYKYLNFYFTLEDFKSIYFWEWLHRLWARLIGIVFIIPFIVFIIRKQFRREMIKPLLILFLLGALQGLVGWIMVQSGLEDSELVYVSHYKLAIHFILAMVVLCYTLWFALKLLVPADQQFIHSFLKKLTGWIIGLFCIQLIYGAFMAGLKAAPAAPTWPDINGSWIPATFTSFGNKTFTGLSFLFDNPLTVQFIHRKLAYIIFIIAIIWWWKSSRIRRSRYFNKTRWIFPFLVMVQIILGIFTVLNVTDKKTFLWLGVGHQFVAMMILLSLVWNLYLIKGKVKEVI